MIPAIPATGTADANPLVRLEDYQRITKDAATSSGDFDLALADALEMLQPEMRRTFLYAKYTERLYVYRNGQVYPSATPIDVSKPIQNADGAAPPANVGTVQGAGIWVGWYVLLPGLPVYGDVVPPQTDISYYGGWVGPGSTLGQQFLIPAKVVRIICRVVWFILHPAVLAGLPGGAKSTSVSGVSLSGDLSSMVVADPQLRRDIARWRKRQARGWGAQVTP